MKRQLLLNLHLLHPMLLIYHIKAEIWIKRKCVEQKLDLFWKGFQMQSLLLTQ